MACNPIVFFHGVYVFYVVFYCLNLYFIDLMYLIINAGNHSWRGWFYEEVDFKKETWNKGVIIVVY